MPWIGPRPIKKLHPDARVVGSELYKVQPWGSNQVVNKLLDVYETPDEVRARLVRESARRILLRRRRSLWRRLLTWAKGE